MPKSALASQLPPHSPQVGLRGALDSIVQGSLVDLFAAYSVALAPLPRTPRALSPSPTDITARVLFNRPRGVGRVTLSVPVLVLDDMSRAAAGALRTDWARELANQLTGRIKNRLLQFNVRLQLGASAIVDPGKVVSELTGVDARRFYAARTLRGQVLMCAEGLPEDSELVYVGGAMTAAEGDTILF